MTTKGGDSKRNPLATIFLKVMMQGVHPLPLHVDLMNRWKQKDLNMEQVTHKQFNHGASRTMMTTFTATNYSLH